MQMCNDSRNTSRGLLPQPCFSMNFFLCSSESEPPSSLVSGIIDYNMPLTSTYLKQMKLRVMNSQEQVSRAPRAGSVWRGCRGLARRLLEDAFGNGWLARAGQALPTSREGWGTGVAQRKPVGLCQRRAGVQGLSWTEMVIARLDS